MNIAYATIYDSRDITRGSGTYYHIAQEIERQGHKIFYLGPIKFDRPLISRLNRRLHVSMSKRYLTFLDPLVGNRTGQQIAAKLAGLDYDVLLTNDFAIAAFTPSKKPVVIYTDMMITHNFIERHLPNSRLANVSPISLTLGRYTIKRGLKRSSLCVFPTQWIADEALIYGADESKIEIIPFGANIDDPGRTVAEDRSLDKIKEKGRLDCLFVGKDWERKGGDIAVLTVQNLKQQDIPAVLHIVGSTPRLSVDDSMIKFYGVLDKSVQNDRQLLDHLYRICDLFIFPSTSEGSVIVVREAAAYGLPTIAYNVIGVSSAIITEKTGFLLDLNQTEDAFVNVIMKLFDNPNNYEKWALGARQYYEETANWTLAVSNLIKCIQKI
jgi:glycosyltransferase involved in cell wall biosynthesis